MFAQKCVALRALAFIFQLAHFVSLTSNGPCELCVWINEIVKKMLFTIKIIIMMLPNRMASYNVVYGIEKCSTSSAMVRRQSTDLFVLKKCGVFLVAEKCISTTRGIVATAYAVVDAN